VASDLPFSVTPRVGARRSIDESASSADGRRVDDDHLALIFWGSLVVGLALLLGIFAGGVYWVAVAVVGPLWACAALMMYLQR
jgi:hypothetical protein